MRSNSIASLLLVFIVVIVAVGFMRGWFQFSSAQRPSGKMEVELSIDPEKAQDDAEKVRRRTDEFFDKVRSEASDESP